MGYDPNQAPAKEPRRFSNQARCVVNEIISLQDAVDQKVYRELPEGASGEEPYWNLQYEALDARLEDGTAIAIKSGAKLFTKEGKVQDNTQRPAQVAKAFAGLGISVFPGDPTGKFDRYCASIGKTPIGSNPSYDASKVVGNCFTLLSPLDKFGAPIPTGALGSDFVFVGEVRTIKRKDAEVGEDGVAAPATANGPDILAPENTAMLAGVLAAIDGHGVGEDLFDVLRAAGIDNRLMIGGESLLAAAVAGSLAATLAEKGLVALDGGKINKAP
jgi:hypothetical protein